MDTSRRLSTRAGALVVAGVAVFGLAGAVLAGMLGVSAAEAEPPPPGAMTKPSSGATKKKPSDDTQADSAKRRAPAPEPGHELLITGRIIDLEGHPIAGVTVKPGAVHVPKTGDLAPWLDTARGGGSAYAAYQHTQWHADSPATATRVTTTDKDGRFRIEGIGAERIVNLTLQGDAIAYNEITVVTRNITTFPTRGFVNPYAGGTQNVYGASFTYTAAPGRPVVGVVTDGKTGQPLAGANVFSYAFAGSNFVGTQPLKTTADGQGRFRLTGLPKGRGNKIIVVPNDKQPYFMQEFELPDSPGMTPMSVEARLHRGIWIEGKVTEQATGKPVQARLHYLPFRTNKYAQETAPVFDRGGNTHGVGYQDRYETKPAGSFRLVGLPGRAIVGVLALRASGEPYQMGVGSESIKGINQRGHFETYRNPINPGKLWPNVMKEIDPKPGTEVVHVDFQVRHGATVRLKVVDVAGAPVSGLKSMGRTQRGHYDRDERAPSETTVVNLANGEERSVVVLHEQRKLGKIVRVHEGDDAKGPVVVALEPLASLTGRVVDHEGNPVAGANVTPLPLPSGDFGLRLPPVTSDASGRFRAAELPPGCEYSLTVESPGTPRNRRFAFLKQATVKPGETTDVGEIKFDRD
jgi:protocatechuate 3,4-dioxygenase beta subunit